MTFEHVVVAVRRLSCAVWGHVVDQQPATIPRRCRCGAFYLHTDGRTTHVRHTMSCFLRHHTYVPVAERDGVHEYVCIRCGHPLVFPALADRFAGRDRFAKRVRYRCGLFGHRVRLVAVRDGLIEYACHCGHSFLKPEHAAEKVRHPLTCILTAHRVRFLATRGRYAEYMCVDCGHPFCFPA